MARLQQEPQAIFDDLYQALSFGWLYTCTARHIRMIHQDQQIACARYFFISSFQACLNQSLAVLSKLTRKDDPEHSTLHTLLEAAQTHPDTFPFATPAQVVQSIEEYQILLHETVQNIQQMQLDQTPPIGDLEKIRENDEAFSRLIASDDLEKITKSYLLLMKMTNGFHTYYQNSKLHFRYIEEEIQDDVSFIVQLLNGGCI